MMKKLITSLTLTLSMTVVVRAQQLPVFAQYNLNPVIINPAYAGLHDAMNFTAVYRKQWLGIEGAPETVTFSAHAPFTEYNIGAGITFWRDRIGATSQTAVQSSYSYRIQTGAGTLSFGLQVGLFQYSTDFSDSNVGAIDDIFLNNDINAWRFNTGAGLFLSSDKYFAGISAPLLLNSQYSGSGEFRYEMRQHYFAMAGYIFDINEDFSIKPFTVIRMVGGSPLQADINALVYYKDRVSAGLQYRTKSTFGAILEFAITDELYFGYSLDFISGDDLPIGSDGSHEFTINYFMPWRGNQMETFRKF